MNVALLLSVLALSIGSVWLEKHLVASGRRTGTLYCRVGIGFHLQINPNGRVNGSHQPNHLSLLELFSLSQGVIGIRGVHSKRFLAMNKRGWLHATETFSDDCKFRERFQENSYNTYASLVHRNHRTGREWFVAINKKGKAKMGSSPRVKPQHMSTHFLPRMNLLENPDQGFAVTDKHRKEPSAQVKPRQPKVVTDAKPPKGTRTVRFWPKFRFG